MRIKICFGVGYKLFRDRNHIFVILLLSSERDALYYVDVAHDLHRTACGRADQKMEARLLKGDEIGAVEIFRELNICNNGRNALMPAGRDRQTDTRA